MKGLQNFITLFDSCKIFHCCGIDFSSKIQCLKKILWAGLVLFAGTEFSRAASATWNGTADSTWTNTANWSASPVPGITDTATFNNDGNANTTISLAGGAQIQNIVFDTANAAAYTIGSGTAGSQTLTMSGSGEFTVNSTVVNNELFNANLAMSTASGPRTLAFTNNSTTAGQSLTFAGGMTAGAAGTKTVMIGGSGNTIISGNMSDGLGQLALTESSTGILTLSGTAGFSGDLTVAQGVLNVCGNGAVIQPGGATTQILIGTLAGPGAAVYQNGAGTVVSNSKTGGGGFDIGAAAGAYGYYNLSSGFIDVAGELDPGGAGGGAGTFGQFDMTGGTVNLCNSNPACYFNPNRNMGGNESSVVNILGGTVQVAGGGVITDLPYNGLNINWSGTTTAPDRNATTICGSGKFLTPTLRVKLNQGANYTGTTGIPQNFCALNLNNGGLLQTLGFLNGTNGNNTGTSINFNGGILRAGNAGNASFLTGLGGVYFYSGGGTIDDNGQIITIAQPLLAPTGNGVVSIPVTAAGSNYIVPPHVVITDGTGAGASAYATINPTNGALTGVVVTSPGNNYTSPTATLIGVEGTNASLGAVTIAANVSGGLAKAGAGTLTLSGSNTYIGGTIVSNGALMLGTGGSLASTNITVASGATLDVSAISFTLNGNQSLSGSGTVTGSVSTVSGSQIYPGTNGGYGTNTFNNNLTFAPGASACFDLSSTAGGANDQIVLNGTSSVLNCGGASIGINCGATLDQTNDYPLFTLTGGSASIVSNFNATPVWTETTPVNAGAYTIVTVGNNVVLHYSGGATNLPSVTNLPASNIAVTSATLNGQLLSTGNEFPTVNIFYGMTDGGTNPAAWSASVSMGFQSGSFAIVISNLTANSTYYFTTSASNSAGTAWATPSQSFTTPVPVPAEVTNLPASNVQGSSAILNGQVLSIGSQTPTVTLYYGTADGGTNASNWANNIYLGQQGGIITLPVIGLSTNTTYYYAIAATNTAGLAWATPSASFTTLPMAPVVSVTTYHNDNARTGANTNETVLTPSIVNTNNFGLLVKYTVDGYVYTEPLYMPNLLIPGQGTHNVVFVATENNSLYAFDADGNTAVNGGLLWQTNLGVYILSDNGEFGNRYASQYGDIVPDVGITGTPVIDPASGTLYVDVATREVVAGVSTNYYHRIHALNITNGMEQSYGPVVVNASVPGIGTDSSGGVMTFNAKQSNERPALTLADGLLFVAYAGYGDTDPYHGWLIGYNATNLAPLTNYVFNSTPNATTSVFGAHAAEGGIWMGGNGLCVDANTNLYFQTGNGSFSANTNGRDYADSMMKLSTSNSLAVADYFTPYNQLTLANNDTDLGSCGAVLLPDCVGSTNHPHLIVSTGKSGTIYLVDRDNMGHYNGTDGVNGNDSQIVQSVTGRINNSWSSPAYFNNQIYLQASSDTMKSFAITNGVIVPMPASVATAGVGIFNGGPVVSANGTNNGIVWVLNNNSGTGTETLYACNATNISQQLYNSSQLARDYPGLGIKMTTPTVANGKVYVGAQYALSVYGLTTFVATPAISPNGGNYANSATVTLSDATPGTAIYYTLDGTVPTTNSLLYTAPFAITRTLNVHAVAVKSGAVNSGVASASFVNTAALGSGVGLQGQYWTNTDSTVFTNVSFNIPATLVRTDAVVNFNWSSTGPDPSIGQTNFTASWTGSVQAQYNETYTFTTIADDGVRLWVNGQLLVDDWNEHSSPATNSGSITLNAQQLYNIQLDYFQANSNAVVQLLWSSPSTAQAIVPQTQLYPYTNPPPTVELSSPADGSAYTADASVTVGANADAPYNPVVTVSFYANGSLLETLSNSVDAPLYEMTVSGLAAGSYALSAVATDGSGLSSTSAPVNITVNPGSGLPYGLTTNAPVTAFLNMPTTFNGTLPALLSQTGALSDTTNRIPAGGLIPYAPNTILWSDGAVKSRYMAVPGNGGTITPGQQISFLPTNSWTFPAGTVFVKNFDLVVNQTNPAVPLRRLETRLLVRDINGAVYGVTYKWRPDNSDADLLLSSSNENILITNATGVSTQTWYYPSPADCLTCHTPVAGYVLGVSTRQLNGNLNYPATGNTDNQLRTLNRLGLFNPAFDESAITNFESLSALTNLTASLQQRARSYLDANCAQCHQPGGAGITFDARYDTPLPQQNITNFPAAFSLGVDNACIIKADDVWRSVLLSRINTNATAIKMPPLARGVIDTNAVQVFNDWINSLPGVPVLAPPTITPGGGTFVASVNVSLQVPDTNATIYYTLDGSLPTTNSILYSGAFNLTGNGTVTANAFETNFYNSIGVSAQFLVQPLNFTSEGFDTNNLFELGFSGVAGSNYVLEASTNLINWTSISTNNATTNLFNLLDPDATNFPYRFYRVFQQ
jgi:autotransporter-associated beta strand protein